MRVAYTFISMPVGGAEDFAATTARHPEPNRHHHLEEGDHDEEVDSLSIVIPIFMPIDVRLANDNQQDI